MRNRTPMIQKRIWLLRASAAVSVIGGLIPEKWPFMGLIGRKQAFGCYGWQLGPSKPKVQAINADFGLITPPPFVRSRGHGHLPFLRADAREGDFGLITPPPFVRSRGHGHLPFLRADAREGEEGSFMNRLGPAPLDPRW